MSSKRKVGEVNGSSTPPGGSSPSKSSTSSTMEAGSVKIKSVDGSPSRARLRTMSWEGDVVKSGATSVLSKVLVKQTYTPVSATLRVKDPSVAARYVK